MLDYCPQVYTVYATNIDKKASHNREVLCVIYNVIEPILNIYLLYDLVL